MNTNNENAQYQLCPKCNGTGTVDASLHGYATSALSTCPVCHGAMIYPPLTYQEPPLTKLEEFTKAAMQGLCANPNLDYPRRWTASLAEEAIQIARATLAALEKEKA